MNCEEYLNKKSEFYEKFDLFKALRFKNLLNIDFHQNIIQVLGTNAKGSTGRYLALMLANTGCKVGHFISPHINSFKERFSIYDKCDKASDIDESIEQSHIILQDRLMQVNHNEELSYFEYLCFLAVFVFSGCDYVVFEAGVGGEYDATSIFKRDLCIFTPISKDHCDLLGDDIDMIFRTKIKAMSKVNIFANKTEMIQKAALQKGVVAKFLEYDYSKLCLDKQEFLKANFSLAQLAYFELIQHFYVGKAIKLDLRARCERLASNIIIDVGHNYAAALNLKKEIKKAFNTKISLIANFFANKDVFSILEVLKDDISELLVLKYESKSRELARLDEICNKLGIKISEFKQINDNKNYAVFGSFILVQEFLKRYDASKIL